MLDVEFREAQNEDRSYRGVKINPLWGWGFAPNVDVIWDQSGRERKSMTYRFRTVPIPGYEDYGTRDDGWNSKAQHTMVVLGDSFTFGAFVELEDIWCERIEARNPGIDMLNLATGSGIAKAGREYEVLKDRLPPHEAIIYEMYLGNEFLDNYVFPDAIKNIADETAWNTYMSRRARILGFSKLLFGAHHLASKAKAALLGSKHHATQYEDEPDGYWDERFGNFLLKPKNPILLRYAETTYTDDRIPKGIEETERRMVRLRDLAGGKRFLILLFPFKEMTHFDVIREKVSGIDIGKPNRIVMELCQKHDIPCADLTESIRQHANENLYWDYDHHFNRLGQYYASQAAEQALRSHGLLPAGPQESLKSLPAEKSGSREVRPAAR